MEASFFSTVLVIYGPLSGRELWTWQCFNWLLGSCFALLVGTTESLDVLENHIHSSSVRCRWSSVLVVGCSTGMEDPCLSKSSRWRLAAIHDHSSLTFWQVLWRTWAQVPPVFWRQESAPWTWFIIRGKTVFLHILKMEELPTAPWTKFWAA